MHSQAYQAIKTQGKIKRYLMGFAVGYTDSHGRDQDIEERKPGGNYYSIVFPKKAKALEVAEGLKAQGHRAYVRPYCYETPNPENAKGMLLLSDTDEKLTYI